MDGTAAGLVLQRRGEPGREIPVALAGGRIFSLEDLTADIDGAFLENDGIARARAALAAGDLQERPDLDDARLGPPIARPGKIVCVGLNYSEHARETSSEVPLEPVLFMKDPHTVAGPNDDIRIPPGSTKTDWEVELAVVMAREARYLPSPADSAACIGGFVLSHDLSERHFQLERGGQWDKGKSCETFNPLGPSLVPPDGLDWPLRLQLSVNGELRQDGTTDDMIFDVAHLVWYISQFMVVRPGDLINTGTPAGVGLATDGPYLKAGDIVELTCAGLGRSRQRVLSHG